MYSCIVILRLSSSRIVVSITVRPARFLLSITYLKPIQFNQLIIHLSHYSISTHHLPSKFLSKLLTQLTTTNLLPQPSLARIPGPRKKPLRRPPSKVLRISKDLINGRTHGPGLGRDTAFHRSGRKGKASEAKGLGLSVCRGRWWRW